jgi:hypothetical protein
MRTALAFVTGILVTMIAATHLTPTQTHYQTIARTETVVQVDPKRILDQLRDDQNIDPDLADSLYIECIKVIERRTDEPLMGIILHVQRSWSSDACTAADHLIAHGWY